MQGLNSGKVSKQVMLISFTNTTTVIVIMFLRKWMKSCSHAVYYKPLQFLYKFNADHLVL